MSAATVLNWEKGKKPPLTSHLGAVITFIGYYPFPEPETVGEQLLRVRRIHGWSIREAALHLGVDQSTWGNWERDELILFKRHRIKVALLLGIDEATVDTEMRTRWNGKHRRWERCESSSTDDQPPRH